MGVTRLQSESYSWHFFEVTLDKSLVPKPQIPTGKVTPALPASLRVLSDSWWI
jgi:hypothetical protein